MADLIKEIKSTLSRLGTQPRKKWGQNFMVNDAVLSGIADALDIQKGEMVLEIGPGLGFLTEALLKRGADVLAVEMDPWLVEHLKIKFAGQAARFEAGDILEFDFKKCGVSPVKVAGNIPYNITSPILETLIDNRKRISTAVLTMQAEVAERLCADPGSKIWGSLSVFTQLYADTEIVKRLTPDAFYPSPKVNSAVVRLRFPKAKPYKIMNEEALLGWVRKAFQKRRKTLLNALREDEGTLSKENLERALAGAQIDPIRRPETLSINEWITLAERLAL